MGSRCGVCRWSGGPVGWREGMGTLYSITGIGTLYNTGDVHGAGFARSTVVGKIARSDEPCIWSVACGH